VWYFDQIDRAKGRRSPAVCSDEFGPFRNPVVVFVIWLGVVYCVCDLARCVDCVCDLARCVYCVCDLVGCVYCVCDLVRCVYCVCDLVGCVLCL
jgi:hypothetical protein